MADKLITELQLRSSVTDGVNFPSDDTIQSYRVTAAQIKDYLKAHWENINGFLKNVGLATSVNTGALTIALKQSNGSSDPASTDSTTVVQCGFRSPTLTSGAKTLVDFNAALNIVIPSGATFGYIAGDNARVFIYLYYDGTNKGMMVSPRLLDESQLYAFTAIGTGSDSNGLYADAIRSGAAVRLIGDLSVNSIGTAGVWTAPTYLATSNFVNRKRGFLRTVIFLSSGTYTKNPYADEIEVIDVGGGGGGGGADGQGAGTASAGAGGTGGGAAKKLILNTAVGDTETVTIGAGGTAGASTGGDGGTGGTTSFGALLTATGGAGGSGDSSGGSTSVSTLGGGATPGAGSGGDENPSGSLGTPGLRMINVGHGGQGGAGGYGMGEGGVGGRGSSGATAGSAPNAGYGGGGGGGGTGNTSSNAAGGAGIKGVCIVREHKL